MPITPSQAQEWHRSLVSIYYYGRRRLLPGSVTLNFFRPLDLPDAVSGLVQGHALEARPSIRLALTDLCRTRAAGADPLVDTQIGRLATELSAAVPTPNQPDFVRYFTVDIFQHAPTEDQVYRDAIKYLAKHFQPADRTGVSLISYEEGLR